MPKTLSCLLFDWTYNASVQKQPHLFHAPSERGGTALLGNLGFTSNAEAERLRISSMSSLNIGEKNNSNQLWNKFEISKPPRRGHSPEG